MNVQSASELETLLAAAATGAGTRLMDRDTFLQLLGYAQAKAYVVYAIEVFEREGDLEIPRVDLKLIGGDLIQETQAMSYEERLAHVVEAVRFTISAADKASGACEFQIWMEEAELWRDGAA